MDNSLRIGPPTSSQASRLIGFESRKMTPEEKKEFLKENPGSRKQNIEVDGFAKPGQTYIEELVFERLMKRTIKTEVKTQAMKWGSLMEIVLFDLLGMEYVMEHKTTLIHPKYKFWRGTPDLIVPEVKIGEIKCYEPKKFMQLSICLLLKDIKKLKDDFPEEYWQCVSNAHICGVKRAELMVYMPYKSELEEIINKIVDTNFLERHGLNDYDYYFMREENIESLPYLPNDSEFSNVNSFDFEIPEEDMKLLENRMIDTEAETKKQFKQFKKAS